jgi:hypothetical protein
VRYAAAQSKLRRCSAKFDWKYALLELYDEQLRAAISSAQVANMFVVLAKTATSCALAVSYRLLMGRNKRKVSSQFLCLSPIPPKYQNGESPRCNSFVLGLCALWGSYQLQS